jgi:hypothetical protein
MKTFNPAIQISDFSPHLFWDVDRTTFLLDRSKRWMMERVLEYGTMKDWKLLTKVYGLEVIKEEVVAIRTMDDVTLSFLCTLFDLKKENFRCYTNRQSSPNFWSY